MPELAVLVYGPSCHYKYCWPCAQTHPLEDEPHENILLTSLLIHSTLSHGVQVVSEYRWLAIRLSLDKSNEHQNKKELEGKVDVKPSG